MFDLEPYKHPDHKERRASILSLEDLCIKRPDERTLPYYSISVEQLEADTAYQQLSAVDQGDFLRLLPLLWRYNGLLPDYPKLIATHLGLSENGWIDKRQRLFSCGLLALSADECNLLNPRLRQQYLNTLSTTNARRIPR